MKNWSIGAIAGVAFAFAIPCAQAATERLVYSFNGSDGYQPEAGLANVNGALYGTTYIGGANGLGAAFSVTRSGGGTLLHSFGSGNDGWAPTAAVIDVNGRLYGTTQSGGALGGGTVYSLTTSGVEKVIHAFKGGTTDGATPVGPLVNVSGTMYGTTEYSGAHLYYGSVFSVTPSGTEKVIYSFQGGADASEPQSGLLNVSGTLYGTSLTGGSGTACSVGCGAVYSVTRSGVEKVIYSFKGGADGAFPESALIDVAGTFYGTTNGGGAHSYGTVFSVTPKGVEKVLYSFTGGGDGGAPTSKLTNVGGTLYGTTAYGGAYGPETGTLFSIKAGGVETVVHSFGNGNDGVDPMAGVIDIGGVLYGTTVGGGVDCQGSGGCGTVFAVRP